MLARQPIQGRAMFVDMNSFFASVEQQARPELRGRPIAVCPYVNDSTCVIAASVEAKRFGVRTGTPIPEARRLCPGIVLISDNPSLYRDYHRRIMQALDDTRAQVIIKSIDEALMLVPSYLQATASDLAHEVKQRIYAIGDHLTCSVGIASNSFLAKMASNAQKPDGLTVITQANLLDFYAGLRLTDLHGIAGRMALRLKLMGIYTPLDFYNTPYAILRQAFGQPGQAWYLRLRGYEVDLRPTKRSMIGHQTTIVPEPARTRDEIMSVASQLTYKAATRLRRSGLAARSVSVHVRFTDRTSWYRLHHGRKPFTDSKTFFDHVARLLASMPLRQPVRRLTVVAFELSPQTSLPQSLFPLDHDERLSWALDEIESRYGRTSIMPARQLQTSRISDRVGFGNAPHSTQELPNEKPPSSRAKRQSLGV